MSSAEAAPRGHHPLGHVVRAALVLVGLLPFVPNLLADAPVLGVLAAWVDSWFEFQCHRQPDRSLAFLDAVLPVCSRCTGIYLGLGLGAIALRPRIGVWPLRIWVGFAAFVMVLDVSTEVLGMRPASTVLRLATGVLLSYPVAVAAVHSARGAFNDDES